MVSVALIAGLVALPVLLLLFSIDAVEQNEYGLLFNWVSKSLSTEVYHGGTHFVGFWNKFLVFPAIVRTIEFSDRQGMSHASMLHTRTKEGLGLHLSISFQYQLDPSRLSELFSVTNMDYENLFIRIARDQLLEAASQYEGPQFWMERQEIGEHMRRLVDEQLQRNFAKLWGLQLQVIDLPDKYEQSVTMTQVQQQMIKTRQNEQTAASIRADTDVLRAEFNRQAQVVTADAQANYTEETKVAEAEAARRKINAEADAVKYVRSKLGLSPTDLVRYQQLQSYAGLPNATFLADMPGAGALVSLAAGSAAASMLQQAPAPMRAAVASHDVAEAQGSASAQQSNNDQSKASFLSKSVSEDV